MPDISLEPKICEGCGMTFLRQIGTEAKYCTKHEYLAIPTYQTGKRDSWRMKEYAWSQIGQLLKN